MGKQCKTSIKPCLMICDVATCAISQSNAAQIRPADRGALQGAWLLRDIGLGDRPACEAGITQDREDRGKVDAALAQLGEDAIVGEGAVIPPLRAPAIAHPRVDILDV